MPSLSLPHASNLIPRTGWTWGRDDEPMVIAPVLPGADRGGTMERFRVAVTLERRMLLEGAWRRMLMAYGRDELGPVRSRVVGVYDISANIFKQVVTQTSTLYDRQPQLRGRDTATLDRLQTMLQRTNYWGVSARHQRHVNAYRTSVLRYKWTRRGALAEPITPDFVYAEPDPEDPTRPVLIRQAVWRKLPDGLGADCGWTVDEWDIRDPDWPRFRVLHIDANPDDTAPNHDLTAHYVAPGRPEDWWGAAYPYRDMHGEPLIPYRLDAAEQTGSLWAARENAEVVHGTLQVGVLMTAFNHAALRASWSQRVLLNGRVPAAAPMGEDGDFAGHSPQHTEADPTMVLNVEDDGKGAGASIAEWSSPVDLKAFLEVVTQRAQGMAIHFGLSPADIVARENAAAASGVSIEVSRKGQRRIEARQAPLFETYDEDGFAIIAALDRAHTGTRWDPREVGLDYAYTEQDPEERARLLELLQAERAEGLISKRQMYARLNRCSEEEAEEALEVVAQQDAATMPEVAAPDVPEVPTPEASGDAPQMKVTPAPEDGPVEPRPESREFLVGDKTTALTLLQQLGEGKITRESAREMLTIMIGLTDEEAARMLASVPETPATPTSDAQAITTTAHPSLVDAEVLVEDEEDAEDHLGRLADALTRMGATVHVGAAVPDGTRGLTTYDDALIEVGEGTPEEQLIVLAHEGGHWLEHVRRGGAQADDSMTRERAAFDLGWGIVQALALPVDEEAYRALHEERLSALSPVVRSEAAQVLADVAEIDDEETTDDPSTAEGDAMDAPKLLLSLLIPPTVHDVWEATQDRVTEAMGDRFTAVGAPHVTVLYMGEVRPEDVPIVQETLAARLATQPPIALTLGSVDTFPANDDGVPVFIRVDGGGNLVALHDDLAASLATLGDAEQHPSYQAHLTLGYLPADATEEELATLQALPVEPVKWEAAQVAVSSRGAEISAVPMRGGVDADAYSEDFRRQRFVIPESVAGNAAKVLGWKDEHGDDVLGMTDAGWDRTRQLAHDEYVTGQDLIEMAAWYARFSKQGKDYSTPRPEFKDTPWRDKGHVSWEGWGGDSAKTWSTEIVERNRE